MPRVGGSARLTHFGGGREQGTCSWCTSSGVAWRCAARAASCWSSSSARRPRGSSARATPHGPRLELATQGALTSGKCSAQCSRSTSRTHARSCGLATRKRASSSRWRSIGAPAITQRTARRSNSSSTPAARRPRATAGAPRPRAPARTRAREPARQRAAQRQHVAVTIGVVARRRLELRLAASALCPRYGARRRPAAARHARRR